MNPSEIRAQIAVELARAQQARADGLEGRARAGARRAAGMALRQYFANRRPQAFRLSAVELIRAYQEQTDAPQSLREICRHLLTRVDPDYHLPVPVDLLAEAQILIDALLEDEKS